MKVLTALRDKNEGHGHVYKRPDGARARCGGPRICAACASDLAELQASVDLKAPTPSVPGPEREKIAAYLENAANVYVARFSLEARAYEHAKELRGWAAALRASAEPMRVTDAALKPIITEYLSHRGENPYRVLRGGQALWETHVPAFRAALSAPSVAVTDLDSRQRVVIEWGKKAFGADHMADPIVRAARFIEEAAEMVQAVGLPKDHAQRVFDHVYSRPAGDPKQEAGGTANTLMALCGAVGLSLDDCQRFEIERCLSQDPAQFAARNQVKLREVDAPPASTEGERS